MIDKEIGDDHGGESPYVNIKAAICLKRVSSKGKEDRIAMYGIQLGSMKGITSRA